MDISTAGLKLWVPPVMRGMTFDGETALVVTIVEEGRPELVLQAPEVDQDLKETVGTWSHTYQAFCSERKRYPNSIGIAGGCLLRCCRPACSSPDPGLESLDRVDDMRGVGDAHPECGGRVTV